MVNPVISTIQPLNKCSTIKTQPVERRESKYNKFVAFIPLLHAGTLQKERNLQLTSKQWTPLKYFKKSTSSLLSNNYLIFRVNGRKYNYNVNIHYLSEKVKLH